MSNAFLNATEYANTMLLLAKNELIYGKLVNYKYAGEVNDDNGLSINVKRPPRFAKNDATTQSAAFAAQDIITGSVNVAVDKYAKVHLSIGDLEGVKSWNDLMRNTTMKSAAQTIAHQIDGYIADQTAFFSNYVGHATTMTNNIGAPSEFNPVHTRLMNEGVPNTDLNAAVMFDDGEEIRGSLIAGNIQDVNATALKRARIPILSDINLYATQQCPSLTVGSRVASGTSLINNGTLSVNYRDVKTAYYQTISIDGQSGAKTVKVGEQLTIDNVLAYDWRRGAALTYNRVFTVIGGTGVSVGSALGTTITMSSGACDLIITPPIIVPNTSDGTDTNGNTAFATCNAAAVNDAAVTFLGAASTSYRIRTAWHKSAITLVTAKLMTPQTGVASFARDPETGISIRYWRGSDFTTGAHGHRFDCIFGVQNLDPLMGSRVSGT